MVDRGNDNMTLVTRSDRGQLNRKWFSNQEAIHLETKHGQVGLLITESQQSVLGCFSDWEVSRRF